MKEKKFCCTRCGQIERRGGKLYLWEANALNGKLLPGSVPVDLCQKCMGEFSGWLRKEQT